MSNQENKNSADSGQSGSNAGLGFMCPRVVVLRPGPSLRPTQGFRSDGRCMQLPQQNLLGPL